MDERDALSGCWRTTPRHHPALQRRRRGRVHVLPSVRQLGYEPEFFLGRGTAPAGRPRRGHAGGGAPPRRGSSRRAVGPSVSGRSRVRSADGRPHGVAGEPAVADPRREGQAPGRGQRDARRHRAQGRRGRPMQELDLELAPRGSAHLGSWAPSPPRWRTRSTSRWPPRRSAARRALRWLSSDPVNYERGGAGDEADGGRLVRRAADVVGRMRGHGDRQGGAQPASRFRPFPSTPCARCWP